MQSAVLGIESDIEAANINVGDRVKDASLVLRKSEIVGLAGMVGSGPYILFMFAMGLPPRLTVGYLALAIPLAPQHGPARPMRPGLRQALGLLGQAFEPAGGR